MRVKIDLDDAAFVDSHDPDRDIADLVRDVAWQIERGKADGRVRDVNGNGNTVGRWALESGRGSTYVAHFGTPGSAVHRSRAFNSRGEAERWLEAEWEASPPWREGHETRPEYFLRILRVIEERDTRGGES